MAERLNIFLIGPMGAGKTSIGKELAKKLQLVFYDSDEVIEERTGTNIPWIFDLEGEEGFRKRETKVIDELTKLRGIVLATGGGAIASPENRISLANNGMVIYLCTSLNGQIERTRLGRKRPLAQEDDKRKLFLQNMRTECEHLYESIADLTYSTDGKPVWQVVQKIVRDLQKFIKNKQDYV